MKTSLLVAGLLAVTANLSATTATAERVSEPTRPGATGSEFLISCYRGPWKQVVWDKPNAVFLDELTDAGYTREQALAIGKRVCRDEYGVGNDDYMRATLLKILSEEPPRNTRKHR